MIELAYGMPATIRPAIGTVEPAATYRPDSLARAFWRLSFRAGRGYMAGLDASGLPILVQHDREEAASYARRLRLTKPRGYVGPILRRYNATVFARPPVRDPDADDAWLELWARSDASGRHIDSVMADALLLSQIERECYLLPDTSEKGSPCVWVAKADAIVNWIDRGDQVREVLMLWADDSGAPVLRWMDDAHRVDYALDADMLPQTIKVVSEGPEEAHGYPMIPVVRLRPALDPIGSMASGDGESQAAPIAESQQSIANLLSLLNEEIANVTFSQMIASGVTEQSVKDVRVGNSRILCLPNPASKVDMIGADPAQARTIREAIDDETAHLYRAAGVVQSGAEQAQSGIALAFRHTDTAAVVGALSDAVEEAEALLAILIAGAWRLEIPARTTYQGRDADPPEFTTETESMATVVGNVALPATLRAAIAARYASRNLSLSDADLLALAGDIQAAVPSNPWAPGV